MSGSDRDSRRFSLIYTVIRVLAISLSVIIIVILIMFMIGEGIPDVEDFKLDPSELLGMIFFPAGVITGMILSWRYDFIGAIITLGSLACFYLVSLLFWNDIPSSPWFIIFASPGFLFLITGIIKKSIKS